LRGPSGQIKLPTTVDGRWAERNSPNYDEKCSLERTMALSEKPPFSYWLAYDIIKVIQSNIK
jgi:hypothetical protein